MSKITYNEKQSGDELTASEFNQIKPSVNQLYDDKQNKITLTTTGSSGASTFNQQTGALNIPNYQTGSGGGTDLGWINVKDYGAIGDGLIDDTEAIQAAADLISENGGVLYFPVGKYLATTITLNNPTLVLGSGGQLLQNDPMHPSPPNGNGNCVIYSNSTSLDLFVVNADRCIFKDISIYNKQASPTAGRGILFNKGQCARIENLTIMRFFINVEFVHGWLWSIDRCFFWGARTFNLIIANKDLGDAGDSCIDNSWFYAGLHTGMTHIKYLSSGGLKINSTKFNMQSVGALHCIDALINEPTIILQVVNCSFENFSGHGIRVLPNNGVAFGNIIILGNEFAPGDWADTGNCITMGGFGYLDQGYPSNVVIDNNIIINSFLGNVTGNIYSKFAIFSTANYVTIGSGNVYRTPDGSQNCFIDNNDHSKIYRLPFTQVIPFDSSVTYNVAKSIIQYITLTGDCTVNVSNNANIQDSFRLIVYQDNIGGKKLTIPNCSFIGLQEINPLPDSCTIIEITYNAYIKGQPYKAIIVDYLDLGRMSTSQKNAISDKVNGTKVYDITLNKYCFWNGTSWETITSS